MPSRHLPGRLDGAPFAAIAGVLIATALFLAPTLARPVLRDVRLIVAAVVLLAGVSVVAIPALIVGAAALVAAAALVGAAAADTAHRCGCRRRSGRRHRLRGRTRDALALADRRRGGDRGADRRAAHRAPGRNRGRLALVRPGRGRHRCRLLAPGAIGAVAGTPPDPATAFVLVQWVALAAVLAAVLAAPGGGESHDARRVGLRAVRGLPAAARRRRRRQRDRRRTHLGGTVYGTPAILGEPALGILRAAALLALFALIALRRTRITAVPALVAAALVPAAASLLTFTVVQTLGLEDHGARALATVGATVTVVWVSAVWSMLRPELNLGAAQGVGATDEGEAVVVPAMPGVATRTVVDLGALLAALTLVWDVPADLRWAMLALVAAGFVGASITRGWAAPVTASLAGVPSIRAAGAPLAEAPRRLLAWPAFAFASAALWSGLSTAPNASSLTVEAYAIPPAVGLFAFAAVLVWLRRHGEAAVAISLSFLLGLAVPALAGWTGSPVRGTVVAIVAAALCLLLTCTPAIRARIPALAGATTALVALALVALERAVDGPPAQVAWLLLLLGVAYASATGAAYAVRPRRSWYAVIVPPVAVVGRDRRRHPIGRARAGADHRSRWCSRALHLRGIRNRARSLWSRNPVDRHRRGSSLRRRGIRRRRRDDRRRRRDRAGERAGCADCARRLCSGAVACAPRRTTRAGCRAAGVARGSRGRRPAERRRARRTAAGLAGRRHAARGRARGRARSDPRHRARCGYGPRSS